MIFPELSGMPTGKLEEGRAGTAGSDTISRPTIMINGKQKTMREFLKHSSRSLE
jgi:hypothetical protein